MVDARDDSPASLRVAGSYGAVRVADPEATVGEILHALAGRVESDAHVAAVAAAIVS